MNKNFPIETRYSTLKRYQVNYENDLKIHLESHEDNTEIDLLENDLFSHKNLLKHLLNKLPDHINIDEGIINQRNINSQKRIIEFIENKISTKTTISTTQKLPTVPAPENTLNWQGSTLEFSEFSKALIESGFIGKIKNEKEVFEKMKQFFNVEDFDKSDKLKQVKNRTKTLTPVINTLEVALTNWIKRKD